MGKNLPTNEFIKFVCEDIKGGPKNVFDKSAPEYIGTYGDYLRFENNKYRENGVMTLCDAEVTLNVIDKDYVKEVEDVLKTCEV